MGTPAVNVGTRQQGRQRGSNVIDSVHGRDQILEAISTQLKHGRYPSEPIYGDGEAGKRIADILSTKQVSIQKRMTY